MRLQLPSYPNCAREEEAEQEVMGDTGHRDTGWYDPRDPPFNVVPGGKARGSNDTQNTVNSYGIFILRGNTEAQVMEDCSGS